MKNFFDLKIFNDLAWQIGKDRSQNHIYISPLFGASKSFFINQLSKTENQILLLLPDIQSVAELNVELNLIGLNKKTIAFTEFTPESIQEKLTEISKKKKFIIISSYDLLNYEFPTKDQIEQKTTNIQVGGDLIYDDLIEYLNLLTYQKDKFVEAPGYYSQRGSIIDFWSYSERNPVRLEFDGDFLESIRYFDPESQRSIEIVETATLAGAFDNKSSKSFTDIFEYLNNPIILASSFELKNLNEKKINVFNSEDDSLISNKKIEEEIPEEVVNGDDEFPEPLENVKENIQESIIEKKNFQSLLEKENTRWIIEEELSTENERINLGFSEVPTINGNYEVLFNTLKEHAEKNYGITITSENELQSTRLHDLLSEFREELAILIDEGKIKLEIFLLKKVFFIKKRKFFYLLITKFSTNLTAQNYHLIKNISAQNPKHLLQSKKEILLFMKTME